MYSHDFTILRIWMFVNMLPSNSETELYCSSAGSEVVPHWLLRSALLPEGHSPDPGQNWGMMDRDEALMNQNLESWYYVLQIDFDWTTDCSQPVWFLAAGMLAMADEERGQWFFSVTKECSKRRIGRSCIAEDRRIGGSRLERTDLPFLTGYLTRAMGWMVSCKSREDPSCDIHVPASRSDKAKEADCKQII